MSNKLRDFLDSIQSVCINSLDENKEPFSSYAPFIKVEGKYYVYLSMMAKHFHNLSNYDKCSLLLLEDEKDCKNIFARKRVSLQCNVKMYEQNSAKEKDILEEFKNKFDENMVEALKNLGDFYIFEFEPYFGQAVFGFGKAYDIGGENFEELLQRENLKGHTNNEK